MKAVERLVYLEMAGSPVIASEITREDGKQKYFVMAHKSFGMDLDAEKYRKMRLEFLGWSE
jgi:hypothetical protein